MKILGTATATADFDEHWSSAAVMQLIENVKRECAAKLVPYLRVEISVDRRITVKAILVDVDA